VIDCNQFFVTLEFNSGDVNQRRAFPLAFVEINYDEPNNRLELIGT
jgi:hypothetical protein